VELNSGSSSSSCLVNALSTVGCFVLSFDAVEFVIGALTLQRSLVLCIDFLGHVFESGQRERWLGRGRLQSVSDDLVEKIGGFVGDHLHSCWRFGVAVGILRLEVLVHVNPGILVCTSYYITEIPVSANHTADSIILM